MANMVYGLAASSDTNPTPYPLKRISTTPLPKPTLVTSVAPLKAQGVIDFLVVLGDGSYPSSSFISDCQANGVTCGINNSNDGTSSNWSLGYYQQLAASGVQWAIGESESGAEMCAMMQAAPGKLIAGTYGGEGTGGPTNNNDIWAGNNYTPNCTIKAGTINVWLETYTSSSMISASEIGTEAGINKDAGTFEQGLCIGSWAQNDYGADQNTYAEMVDEMASNNAPCAGFQWWYTQGGFEWPALFTALKAMYPANMTPILQRAGGVTPPVSTVNFASTPTTTGGNMNIFVEGSDSACWQSTDGGHTWVSLGGKLTSAPTATTRGAIIDVFVRGTDGAVWTIQWTGSAWRGWFTLGGQVLSGTGPEAVTPDGTTIDLYVVGTDKRLYLKAWNGTKWSAWNAVAKSIKEVKKL